jgi:subtilisin-like proprotein convertase family protein
VSGLATEGTGPDHCEIEVATPMPYAEVTDGTTVVFADENGDFVISGNGLRADSTPEGAYFDVRNFLGPLETASAPEPFQLLFNADNTDELVRAQVNGYVEANRVRDFVARFNPSYPTFTDTDIPVWVNRTDGFCPGNAWYDPGDSSSPTFYSINFCQSSSSRPNTAYSSVVHHEFGHHVVNAGGSGQGQYGEGMGDVMGVLILDEPRLGIGFFGDCDGALRSAQNTLQYPCGGSIHFCGQLISGAVWSTRKKLVVDHPTDYIDILANLAINAVLLHNGSLITPAITVDYLTLDDDDGTLVNGTPHYDEINGGFSAHRMPGPAMPTGLQVAPQGGLVSTGTVGDSFVYTLENRDATSIDFSVTALESWITVTGGSGSLAPGATVQVEVSLNSDAELLGDGVHRGNVFFVNETNHDGDQMRGVLLVGGGAVYSSTDVPQFISWVAPVSSTLTIDDDFCIGDVNATVDITHGDVSELIVELLSPGGTSVRLHSPGSSPGTSLMKTYDEQAGVSAAGPGSLSDFNGESPLGSWTLSITDTFLPNTGDLNGWSLELLSCPPTANSIDVTVVKTRPTEIALDAQSTVGNPLNHVIHSLPTQGSLIDPNGGAITSVPYTLLAEGDTVIFDPDNVFTGRDGFSYKGNDGQDSNLAEVDIQVGDRILIEAFPLDSDPGWTTTGAWAFGQPTGQGSRSGDPFSGYTGPNVYGYKLTGNYGSNIGELPLTTSAIDCSGFQDVEVSFRRWLGVEVTPYDHARFEASNDGTSWVTIWEHSGGTIDESSWSLQTYDISAVADSEPTVFLRWVMGSTDGSETYPGWNIDDVELTGLTPVARVDLVVTETELSWAPLADAISYDVVQGDVATLRSSGGDFGVATEACLGDDLAATGLLGPPDPDPGQAHWFLVRGVAVPGSMSYESFGNGQADERDAEIDGAIASCP